MLRIGGIVVEIAPHLRIDGAELMLAQVGGGIEAAPAPVPVPAVVSVRSTGVQAGRIQEHGGLVRPAHAIGRDQDGFDANGCGTH